MDVFNSMSFTLHISKKAWLDSWLNTTISFARSSRIQIVFEPILILSVAFVFVSVSSSFNRFVFRECICADFFFTEVSIHIDFRSGLIHVSRYLVRFCDVFRDVLPLCLLSKVVLCFQRLGTSVCDTGCCGCCSCCATAGSANSSST